MASIWLRVPKLSNATGGDEIRTVRDNAPELREQFGFPDLTDAAEVQAACEVWYPSSLQAGDLDGYEITPAESADPEANPGDIVFAAAGVHADAARRRFEPSKRNTRVVTRP